MTAACLTTDWGRPLRERQPKVDPFLPLQKHRPLLSVCCSFQMPDTEAFEGPHDGQRTRTARRYLKASL